MRQGTSKDAVEFTEGWHSACLPLRVVSYHSDRYFLEENKIFICKWLSIGDCFWLRDICMCRLLISVLGPNLVQKLHTLCMLPQFPLVHMCFNSVEVEGCLFVAGGHCGYLYSPTPLALIHALPPLLEGSVSPEGNVLMETSHSVLFQCFFFFEYCLAVRLSICFFPTFPGGIFFSHDLTRLWSMSIYSVLEGHLRAILFLFFFFLKTLDQFLVIQAVWGMVSSPGVILKLNQSLACYSHKLCYTIILTYLMDRTTMSIKGFATGLMFIFLLGSM